MSRLFLLLAVLGFLPLVAPAVEKPAAPALELHVAPEGWGKAPPANVEAVLRSAATSILQYLPDHELAPIHVSPDGGPIVLYERAADGGYQVRLATRDTYWARYSFQFAHEQTLAEWYAEHAEDFRTNATDCEKNLVIATALLPLFEADPETAWAAVHTLNTAEPGEPQTLAEHFQRWHDHTPAEHQPFVRSLAEAFGLRVDSRP